MRARGTAESVIIGVDTCFSTINVDIKSIGSLASAAGDYVWADIHIVKR